AHAGEALLAEPALGRTEEGLRDGVVLDGLEEAEEAVAVVVLRKVRAVDDGGDAAGDLAALAAALGQEELHPAVLEERVLLRIQDLELVHPQRRDEEEVVGVVPVDEVDEAPGVG